jgi:hypothetical protein
MVGYYQHKDHSIRFRSGGFDVLIGSQAPYTQFVRFDTLDEAKHFIDNGRDDAGLPIYSVETQELV